MSFRCYPTNDSKIYVEYPSSCIKTEGIKPKPPQCPMRYMEAWGSGTQYEKWTGWNKGPYLPGTRIRKGAKLPVAGQKPRYRIHQEFPWGFNFSPIPQSRLQEWLEWLRPRIGIGGKNGKGGKDKKGKKGGKKKK